MPETESDPTPLSRIELLRLAQSLGVSDADVMTRAELRAAIAEARAPAPPPVEQPTTWVGVARRLLASVIERGLNLPDAAALIRGDAKLTTPPKAPPPVATVTLARIYAAQGHLDRAIGTLDEVLLSDPDHELARDLRAQLDLRRQELLARDADALPAERPAEDELTPIMPEVALREAASERGAELPNGSAPSEAPAADSAANDSERAAPGAEPSAASAVAEPVVEAAEDEPVVEHAAGDNGSAPRTERAAEAEPSEPQAELVAPDFSVAQRAERPANDLSNEPRSALAHDSETPPAPSVRSRVAPEIPPTLPTGGGSSAPSADAAADDAAGRPDEDTTHDETRDDTAHDETSAPSASPFAERADAAVDAAPRPVEHGTPNGVANGVVFAASFRDAPAASAEASPSADEADVPSALAAALAAPAREEEPPAPTPGLILIEAQRSEHYLYWELGAPDAGPCWLHIVSHTPSARGTAERCERRFPVQQRRGAVRIVGVPLDAVVRAKLSRAADDKPLAVAGTVRPQESAFEVRFSPRPHAALEAIARRARPVLERATPVYWDR